MYQFDSGADTALFTAIARGYLDLLEPLRVTDESPATPRGPYLETIRQLPWDPDDRYLGERSSEILGNMPAAYVVIAGATVTGHQAEVLDWLVDVRVHVASGWEGQLVEGRLNADVDDPRQDPGVFVIVQHAIEHLHLRDLPIEPRSGSIQVGRVEHLATGPDITAWTIETQVTVRQTIDHDRDGDQLDAIEVNHDVQEGGVIVTQRRNLF